MDGEYPHPLKGISLKVFSVVVFVAMSTLIKSAGQGIATGQITFYRSAFAMVPILVYLGCTGYLRTAFKTDNILGHLARGFVGIVSMSFGFYGLVHLPLPESIARAGLGSVPAFEPSAMRLVHPGGFRDGDDAMQYLLLKTSGLFRDADWAASAFQCAAQDAQGGPQIERAGDSGALREAMLARSDLPPGLRQSIAARVSDALASFVSGCGWLTPWGSGKANRPGPSRPCPRGWRSWRG